MDPPASFSSLPPELVDKICRDSVLRKKDLIALRLTSKAHGIYLSASEEFAKRHFKGILLVYTRYSLQMFVEICKHSTFGPAVKKVQLSCARFSSESFVEEIIGRLRGGTHCGPHDALNDMQRLVNRCDEEEDLEGSSDAGDLLTAAFTALSRWRQPLELSVSPVETRAVGLNRILGLGEDDDNTHWKCDMFGTVTLLLRAATLSRCVVKRLKIWGDIKSDTTDISADLLSALARLPELELDIWSPGKIDFQQISFFENMMTKLLKSAVGLKVLCLDAFYGDSYPDCFHRILSIVSRMRLEKLILTNIDLDTFKPFEQRIDSLRHLELVQCEIQEACLENVLSSVQKNLPQLEYFSISGISGPWRIDQKVVLKGVQGVNEGINKLIQSRQSYLNDPERTIS